MLTDRSTPLVVHARADAGKFLGGRPPEDWVRKTVEAHVNARSFHTVEIDSISRYYQRLADAGDSKVFVNCPDAEATHALYIIRATGRY